MARGKVYLVGAGPGDPELMTLKAKRLLGAADVVLFDRLLDPRMLEGVKAELIDVGKNAGHHKLTQEGINQLLIEKAEAGNIVVRLKGGDPYLFGRGGEEALALQEKGIPFEVVPGVTSSIAAPELAGIPVTHRGVASSLIIVTGHEEPGKETPLDWAAIAALGGTLVVLMGVSRLEHNVAALIKAGKSPQTPAAMVEKGGWPEQRMISATLADIAEKAKEARIESPAILVVGDVVLLADKLGQKKIAILRPAAQQKESAALAESYGFSPIQAPAIALAKKPLPDDLPERLIKAECVAFTSANGVKNALHSPAIRKALTEKMIVAIGPKTAQALAEQGLTAMVPEEYSSNGMEKMLRGKCRSILFLRSAQGSRYLSEELLAAGLFVDDIALYEVVPSGDIRLDELIKRARSVDIFAFTSSSTARYLIERAKAMGLEKQLREALAAGTVAVIGKPTAEELARLGVKVDVMPDKFTFEAMLAALQEKKK
ncbi:MAG: uroporphyrinogen-III C-methyltransferase [Methanothrix sp.]|nr:uroporphyrinogen-III C-methyltransferase [Methanothrix sp.]